MTLLTSSDPWDDGTMGRSTGRILEPRSSRWNGYHGAICFTFYLFHSFLSWRLSVFGNADQFWRAFFLSFLHGFLSFFVVSLGEYRGVCAEYHSWGGRWFQGEDLPSASKTVRQGSTFSRAWWRTDKPI